MALPTVAWKQGARFLPKKHGERQQSGAAQDHDSQGIAAGNQAAHMVVMSYEPHSQNQAKAKPNAIEDAFYQCAGDNYREGKFAPAGDHVATQNFSGAKRQNLIREEADINRANRVAKRDLFDRTQHLPPADRLPA